MNTDFLLIRKMKLGDISSGDEFVRKYYSDILKYCSYHCTSKEDAQDLTQETFIRFFSKLSEYHFEGKSKNYLYCIARNLCIDESRKKRDICSEDDEVYIEIGQVDVTLQQTENQMILEDALKQIIPEFKDVIVLYYFQELKIREIAEVLKISVPLTKYRLKQAKDKLQEIIGRGTNYEY